jgi:bacteriophage N4 adsorption protein B
MFDIEPLLANIFDGLRLIEHELLIFAAFWFVIGLFDELAIDLGWLWMRLTGRAHTRRLAEGYGAAPLLGPAAVLIPAWQEAAVIATTLRHALAVWSQREVRLYVGCYRNDLLTINAVLAGAGSDPRVRLVLLGCAGPTTKADCLNRLYAALEADEIRSCVNFRAVLLHDAEDMVHPAALQVIDAALCEVDFVQLPVRPEPDPRSRWIAGHYADEFAEAHAKLLVVRSALGGAIPAAGVGCGFARGALAALAHQRQQGGTAGPFAAECLTEDYELGLVLSRSGRGGRFLRQRDHAGQLVATRSYFPGKLDRAVRQKTRWIHGIAFQGWDRMGWSGTPFEVWMALRDRRGPLTALVLAAAYLLLAVSALLWLAQGLGLADPVRRSAWVSAILTLTFAGFVWRGALRLCFTAREYGWREGLRAVLRIPVSNIIAIMAGRRALVAYLRSLRGAPLLWDKTQHLDHPAQVELAMMRTTP